MTSVEARPRPVLRFVRRLLVGVLLMGALVVGGTGFRVWQVARVDDRATADVVLVLGAAQYAGTPSDVLEARLRHAKNLYDEGVAEHILTTGGNQPGDTYTEAEAGANWLTANGVPKKAVLGVGEGNDTLGSLRAASKAAAERGWHTAVIVSDPWHSLRARTMAEDVGFEAWTSPTHSGPIVQTRQTQIRYILYETAALLYYRMTNASADQIGITEDVGADK
ncbi:MAG: YdcF family protein [Actinophytocola sp.]|uniref:YdcF family protein n=1 Tax=Actinophytocola sp. TaxID=1872138 RepID=UPI0013206A6D|nr:YdcF family protein [Actinophytocola sp.]MPZ80836.1 YdcF family protein [Actinophytocola sp.]